MSLWFGWPVLSRKHAIIRRFLYNGLCRVRCWGRLVCSRFLLCFDCIFCRGHLRFPVRSGVWFILLEPVTFDGLFALHPVYRRQLRCNTHVTQVHDCALLFWIRGHDRLGLKCGVFFFFNYSLGRCMSYKKLRLNGIPLLVGDERIRCDAPFNLWLEKEMVLSPMVMLGRPWFVLVLSRKWS